MEIVSPALMHTDGSNCSLIIRNGVPSMQADIVDVSMSSLFNDVGLLERNQSSYTPVEGVRGGFFLRKKPLGVMPPGTATLVSL